MVWEGPEVVDIWGIGEFGVCVLMRGYCMFCILFLFTLL